MLKQWIQRYPLSGSGVHKNEGAIPKKTFRSRRSVRNAVISLLCISIITWHLVASRLYRPSIEGVHTIRLSPEPRVAIVAFITSPKTYLHLGLQNKSNYAKLHAYDLYVDFESDSTRGNTWLKFDMVERVIRAGQHDWIWYIDFDTLITNTSMSLRKIIDESLANSTTPQTIDYLVTDDCNGLNDGSFIVRSSSRSIKVLEAARAIHDKEKELSGKSLSDQDAMDAFLKTNDTLTNHVQHIPQWKINAFPEEIGCYDRQSKAWEKGMFVIHFAGAWAHVPGDDPTGQLMRKYESEIV